MYVQFRWGNFVNLYLSLSSETSHFRIKIEWWSYHSRGRLRCQFNQLDEPVDLGKNVNTACLPPQNFTFDGNRCIASGWGKDRYDERVNYEKNRFTNHSEKNVWREIATDLSWKSFWFATKYHLRWWRSKRKYIRRWWWHAIDKSNTRKKNEQYQQAGIVVLGLMRSEDDIADFI